MKIKIEINTDNAAFSDGRAGFEVRQILNNIGLDAEALGSREDLEHLHRQRLMDVNGHRVGSVIIES